MGTRGRAHHSIHWRNTPPRWSAWTACWHDNTKSWIVSGGSNVQTFSRPGPTITFCALTIGALTGICAVTAATDRDARALAATAVFALVVVTLVHEMWSSRRVLLELLATEGPPPPGTGSAAWSSTPSPPPEDLTGTSVSGTGDHVVQLARYSEPDRYGNIDITHVRDLSRWPDLPSARSAAVSAAAVHPDWDTVHVIHEYTHRDGTARASVVDYFDTQR